MILTGPYIEISAFGYQKYSRFQILKSKIEKIRMSGILVMHFLLGAGGAIRIDNGFRDKKIPKKTYIF